MNISLNEERNRIYRERDSLFQDLSELIPESSVEEIIRSAKRFYLLLLELRYLNSYPDPQMGDDPVYYFLRKSYQYPDDVKHISRVEVMNSLAEERTKLYDTDFDYRGDRDNPQSYLTYIAERIGLEEDSILYGVNTVMDFLRDFDGEELP